MKILRFNESNLNLDELEKTSRGEVRGNILVRKLQDEEDLTFKKKNQPQFEVPVLNAEEIIPEITDDTETEFDPNKAKEFFRPGARYKPVFKVLQDGEEDTLKLNDLVKTTEFGSSAGSSLGTKGTREVECIQCLFLALRQTKGEVGLTEDNYQEIYNERGEIRTDLLRNIKVPIKITTDLLEQYRISWLTTFINTANALYEIRPVFTKDKKTEQDNALSRRKEYIFYHIGYSESGSLIDVLNRKYRDDFKDSTKGIPIAKWTPSDIWAIHRPVYSTIIQNLNNSNDIEDFNAIINTNFRLKSLRGISLKKIKNLHDVKIVYNKITPKPLYTFDKIITSEHPLRSLGIKLIAKRVSDMLGSGEEKMDIRSFSGPNSLSDISAEIIGESARHGKIGLSRINHILMNKGLETIPTKKDLLEIWTFSEIKERLEKELITLNVYGEKVSSRAEVSDSLSRILSKWQSMKLAETLYNVEENVANVIVQEMFYYAMSISNDEFECPSYVRII